MAKVAAIKDFYEYALMIGCLCEHGGHTVLAQSPPVDFEAVARFGPDALVVGLFRKQAAFDRPIVDAAEDIFGLETAREVEEYPAMRMTPLLLLGNGIVEREVPNWFHYDLFLYFPDDMHLFLPKVEELALKVKTRRTLSGYICPNCGSRLTFSQKPAKDLFCPRCHTAVSIIDDRSCIYLLKGSGPSCPCTIDQITPRRGETSTQTRARAESGAPAEGE